MLLGFLGYMLAYAAIKDENPWCEIVSAFGGTLSGGNCVGSNDRVTTAEAMAQITSSVGSGGGSARAVSFPPPVASARVKSKAV